MRLSCCLIAILMLCTACSSTIENRNPVGEVFPSLNGQSLEKQPVTELTGTTDGENTRVLLLNSTGKIICFYDRDYSAREALELAEKAKALTR